MTLFNLAHLFLAALGIHYWLSRLEIKGPALALGALAYALSGFYWWEIIHPPILAAFAWFPWLLLCLESLSILGSISWAFKTGLCFAALFLCGSYQIALGAFYAGGLYFIIRAWTSGLFQKDFQRNRFKKPALALASLIWGSLPLLALFIPSLEFIRLSDRAQAPFDFLKFNAGNSLNPKTLLQFLFPVNPLEHNLTHEEFLGNSGYSGLWSPLLIFWAIRKKKDCLKPLLLALGFLFFLISLGQFFPLYRLLCLWAPGFRMLRASFRFIFPTLACGSVLLAWGYEWLDKHQKERGVKKTFFFYGLGLLILAFLRPSIPWGEILSLGVGLMGIGFWNLNRIKASAALKFFQLSFLLSMILTGWYSCPSSLGPASNFDFLHYLPRMPGFHDRASNSRLLLEDGSFKYPALHHGNTDWVPYPVNAVSLFKIRNALGYSPVVYGKTARLMANTPTESWSKLMAVNNYIVSDKSKPDSGVPLTGTSPWQVPFVYVPQNIEVIKDESKMLESMAQKDFDPLAKSFLSDPMPPGVSVGPQSTSLLFQWVKDFNDEESFNIQSPQACLVVFSEITYPGWKAYLDDQPTPLLRANYLFRSVVVPSGNHLVEFRYEPIWWPLIPVGLALWLLGTLTMWVFRLKKRKLRTSIS